MNEIRRKELEAIVDKLVKLYYALDHLGGEEGDAYENLPRELRQTERAEMMIEAEDFSGEIIKYIEKERCNAEYATDVVSKNLISMLLQMDDEYMNGRVADIKDITQRILCILTK